MKNKKILSLLLATAMTVGLLAGCGGGQGTAETEAAPVTEAAVDDEDAGDVDDAAEEELVEEADNSEEAGEAVTISMMSLWAEDNTENIATSVREALEKFQAENPHITVEVEAIGDQDAYYTKLKTYAAANKLPDVFVSKGSELSTFAKAGLVASLDDVLNANPEWKAGYLPTAFDDLSTDGNVYGVPYSMLSTHVIYYNKDILADAGYDAFPTTWADFTAMCEEIEASGIAPIALGNKEGWVANSCIISALGDRYTGSDWFRSIIANDGAKFTDQEFVDALAALQELGTNGAFNSDMNSINNDQQKTLYFNEEAAMFMEGSWAIGAVVEGPEGIAEKTGVAVLPAVDGGKGDAAATSGGSGSGFAASAEAFATKQDAIAKLLEALSGEEYSKSIAAKGEPVAFVVEDYDKSNVSDLSVAYADMAAGLSFTPIYDSFLDPAVITVMNNGLQEILIGAVSPEDCAANIQAEYEKIYN